MTIELLNDLTRPERAVEATLGEAQDGVAQVRGVERARVEDDLEWHLVVSACALWSGGLFVHAAVVCDLDHAVEGLAALGGAALPVGQHIGKADPAVSARLLEGYLS